LNPGRNNDVRVDRPGIQQHPGPGRCRADAPMRRGLRPARRRRKINVRRRAHAVSRNGKTNPGPRNTDPRVRTIRTLVRGLVPRLARITRIQRQVKTRQWTRRRVVRDVRYRRSVEQQQQQRIFKTVRFAHPAFPLPSAAPCAAACNRACKPGADPRRGIDTYCARQPSQPQVGLLATSVSQMFEMAGRMRGN
jgi:hypothetical protein